MTNLTFYAQPYNIHASGFYFSSKEVLDKLSENWLDDYGQAVEEYEIQFIDGDELDAKLFEAMSVNQVTITCFIEHIDQWDDQEKLHLLIAADYGHTLNACDANPDDYDITIYEVDDYRELALHFVDEGLFGDIPPHLQNYIDYDAIARDLRIDYCDITIAGTRYIYQCH